MPRRISLNCHAASSSWSPARKCLISVADGAGPPVSWQKLTASRWSAQRFPRRRPNWLVKIVQGFRLRFSLRIIATSKEASIESSQSACLNMSGQRTTGRILSRSLNCSRTTACFCCIRSAAIPRQSKPTHGLSATSSLMASSRRHSRLLRHMKATSSLKTGITLVHTTTRP